jgi:hypothetical protein
MLVARVHRQTAAARLGLERGDVIVSIDAMRFTTLAGYEHALGCATDYPSLLIREGQTGQLSHRSGWFPHRQFDLESCRPKPPDSYRMSIAIPSELAGKEMIGGHER